MHTNSVVLGLLRPLHRPENVLVVLSSMEGHAVLPQVQPGRVWLWDYDLWGMYVAGEQLLVQPASNRSARGNKIFFIAIILIGLRCAHYQAGIFRRD